MQTSKTYTPHYAPKSFTPFKGVLDHTLKVACIWYSNLNVALSLVVFPYRLPPRLFIAHHDRFRHRHELLVFDTAIFTPSLQRCQFVLPLYSTFLSCSSSFWNGMLNFLHPVFKISHITQLEASFPEFIIDGHYFTSPNQQDPPTLSFSHSGPLPDDASQCQLRGQVWAEDNRPYLPFGLFSPFHGAKLSALEEETWTKGLYSSLSAHFAVYPSLAHWVSFCCLYSYS